MILEDRVEKSKARLMLEHPFFGSLATMLKFEQSDDIAYFEVKGDSFVYNDEYLNELNDEELLFCIANGALHQTLHHQQRKEKRISWLWHLATDYTINSILAQNGFSIPANVNFDESYGDMYAEEIYEDLRSKIQHEEEREDEGEESENQKRDQDINKQQYILPDNKDFIEAIVQKYQKQGALPSGLDRVIDLVYESQIDWRDRLYRYINSHAMSDYRFFPPNKKYIYLGYALPAVYGERLEIAVAVDTSASVDRELLESFLGELQAIMSVYDNYEITFIEADDKIQNVTKITAGTPLQSTLKGGGGTDFRAVFSYLQDMEGELRFLIYFTDGEGRFPSYLPYIDTLWVTSNDKEFPFGDHLLLK